MAGGRGRGGADSFQALPLEGQGGRCQDGGRGAARGAESRGRPPPWLCGTDQGVALAVLWVRFLLVTPRPPGHCPSVSPR